VAGAGWNWLPPAIILPLLAMKASGFVKGFGCRPLGQGSLKRNIVGNRELSIVGNCELLK